MSKIDIRNRKADVNKLACNVCQDFLQMILIDDWQEELYEYAKKQVEENTNIKSKYENVYLTMRESSPNEYSVKRMDDSLIYTIVKYRKPLYKPYIITNETKDIMYYVLRSVRNKTKGHPDENETPEKLYLNSLLTLAYLKAFINSVDTDNTTIEDDKRKNYYKKYKLKIDKLERTIVEENNSSSKNYMLEKIENDIKLVLSSNYRSRVWSKKIKWYIDGFFDNENDFFYYLKFVTKAYEMGITEALPYLEIAKEHIENKK